MQNKESRLKNMQNSDIGNALKKLREDQKVSQKALSAKTKIAVSKLSKIENNHQLPTLEETTLILTNINVTLIDFFTEVEKINNKSVQLESAFQKIILHHSKHKQSHLSLIEPELSFFKQVYSEFDNNNLFNSLHKIEWYLQLHALFPSYFPNINLELINYNAEHILNKKIWLQQDFKFFAVSLKFLYPNTILSLANYYHKMPFKVLTEQERRAFQISIENLTDIFLVNHKKLMNLNINVKKELKQLFQTWERYIQSYQVANNQLIKLHNYSIYEFIFELKPVNQITEEVKERSAMLNKLGLSQIAEAFHDEYINYKNGNIVETSYVISH